MYQNGNKLLEEIQRKRQCMIESATRNGFTSEETIRCSEELDQLIYQYQIKIHKGEKGWEESRLPYKHMIVWPKALTPICKLI
ncbi:aspartyl-phosphate phosphatase Spo0E family protein [Bacillus sp. V3-13]|uniref:aspartyl-phosphate phosphatase Spo0E family protein n=1 Tax=Bacillus sp. V3-13 TaxID=2053728 RepID=UPI0021530CB5|nr:aspartyl-phosphate phosphatase Spo0E family protein [Bacillus sp. V3-13]